MKVIQHNVFTEARSWYPFRSIFVAAVAAQRARSREKIRQRAEVFINEIGLERVVSITESVSTFGAFSVVVWWDREVPVPETETLVIRPADERENA